MKFTVSNGPIFIKCLDFFVMIQIFEARNPWSYPWMYNTFYIDLAVSSFVFAREQQKVSIWW